MIKKVRYEEMFPDEFKSALNNKPVAYLPLGNLEWHGYQNVLGLDSLKAWRICELAAQEIGGVVLPPLYLGVDIWPDIDLQEHPNKQYDCYHVDKDLYQKMLESYFYRIFRIGFEKIFVLAGHYPNLEIAQKAADSQQTEGKSIILCKEPDLIPNEVGDHAGKWETSLMMSLYPNFVNLKKMEGKENPLMGVHGINPNESTKEYGDTKIAEIISKIKELLEK